MKSDLTINITNYESYFNDFINKYHLSLNKDIDNINYLYIKNISNVIELKDDLIEIFLDIILDEVLSRKVEIEKLYKELKTELKLQIQSIAVYNSIILKANITTYLLNNNYINVQSYLLFNIPESMIGDYIDIANFIQASIYLKTLEIDKNKLLIKHDLEVREKEEEKIDDNINVSLSLKELDISNFENIEIIFDDEKVLYKGLNNIVLNLENCKEDIGYFLDISNFDTKLLQEEILAYKIIKLIILLKSKRVKLENNIVKEILIKKIGKYIEIC